ncbi:MAG: c-type cytochrome [Planctomycetota bacterium]
MKSSLGQRVSVEMFFRALGAMSIILGILFLVFLLSYPGKLFAQEEPSECVEMGALAYDNWSTEDAGGSGMPAGESDNDYLKCKACHGWDRLATEGGYVRRSRSSGQTNAGAGDSDATSRIISTIWGGHAPITAEMILHSGTGRSWEDGSGSWVPLDDTHSAANKEAHSRGYTLGNQHVDLSSDGVNGDDVIPTNEQIDCLVEFLNFADADPSVYFDDINPDMNPVLYTIVSTADADAGDAYYNSVCVDCHGDPATDHQGLSGGKPAGGILAYLAKDGKFSEFSHKARWGIPGAIMQRERIGNPTSADIANIMLYLQELGGTGFAMNPGLTGTWWNAARSGEGFVLEFGFSNDTLTLFASFYTYDNMGNQVWLTAQSTAMDGTSATVNVFISDGPMWGDDYDPADVNLVQWGTGTFTFPSCTAGSVSLTPSTEGFSDLAYDLTRDAIVSGIACPTPTGG